MLNPPYAVVTRTVHPTTFVVHKVVDAAGLTVASCRDVRAAELIAAALNDDATAIVSDVLEFLERDARHDRRDGLNEMVSATGFTARALVIVGRREVARRTGRGADSPQ